MARGADAKLRRRNKRKEGDDAVTDMFDIGNGDTTTKEDDTASSSDEDADPAEKVTKKKKSKKKREYTEEEKAEIMAQHGGAQKGGIKTLPLIFLIIMTGSTVLPALIYMSDYAMSFAQKNHVMGNIGYQMGLGAVPKKRVMSFYEKHDPNKIPDVPTTLSKYYGDYPTLVKKLERKYGDYGYFLGWEEDEAPMTMAFEQLEATRDYFVHQYWNRYAPQVLKTAARNIRYNVTFLIKRVKKVWKKQVWPILEPIVGVPKGAEKQKRQDAADARKRKAEAGQAAEPKRKKKDFRDDVDE